MSQTATLTTTTTKPHMASLNIDIFLYIINHLHGDAASLSNASLVSRSWLSPCQCHLFSSLRIYGKDEDCDSPAQDFLRLLERKAEIAGYIRQLELLNQRRPRRRQPEVARTGDLANNQGLTFSFCFAIISKLRRLQTLKVSGAKVDIAPSAVPSQLSSITNLYLRDLEFQTTAPSSLWDILRLFPTLGNLVMVEVECPSEAGTQEKDVLCKTFPRLPIQTLALFSRSWVGDPHYSRRIFQGLLDRGCLQAVSSLDVACGWYDGFRSLDLVLEESGSRLNFLALTSNVFFSK